MISTKIKSKTRWDGRGKAKRKTATTTIMKTLIEHSVLESYVRSVAFFFSPLLSHNSTGDKQWQCKAIAKRLRWLEVANAKHCTMCRRVNGTNANDSEWTSRQRMCFCAKFNCIQFYRRPSGRYLTIFSSLTFTSARLFYDQKAENRVRHKRVRECEAQAQTQPCSQVLLQFVLTDAPLRGASTAMPFQNYQFI